MHLQLWGPFSRFARILRFAVKRLDVKVFFYPRVFGPPGADLLCLRFPISKNKIENLRRYWGVSALTSILFAFCGGGTVGSGGSGGSGVGSGSGGSGGCGGSGGSGDANFWLRFRLSG